MRQFKAKPIELWAALLLAALLLRGQAALTCSKGCLKCLSTRECILCDIANDYARISGTCIESSLENCTMRLFNGECLTCTKGFFLDLGKCVSAGGNAIANCEVYFTATSCQICAEEHYLRNGQCERVKQVISDCVVYNSDGSKCERCRAGLILSLDLLQCDSVSLSQPVANCLSYNQIGCKECKSGFTVDLNKVGLSSTWSTRATWTASRASAARASRSPPTRWRS